MTRPELFKRITTPYRIWCGRVGLSTKQSLRKEGSLQSWETTAMTVTSSKLIDLRTGSWIAPFSQERTGRTMSSKLISWRNSTNKKRSLLRRVLMNRVLMRLFLGEVKMRRKLITWRSLTNGSLKSSRGSRLSPCGLCRRWSCCSLMRIYQKKRLLLRSLWTK